MPVATKNESSKAYLDLRLLVQTLTIEDCLFELKVVPEFLWEPSWLRLK